MQMLRPPPLKLFKTLKTTCLALLLFNLNSGEALSTPLGDKASLLQLSQDPFWHRILYFHNTKSMVDNQEFFLSPKGKTDPHKELLATIEAIKESRPVGYLKRPAACIFPAHKKWIEEKANIKFPEISCPEFQHWKKVLNVGRIVMVYSAEYPGNPASMFGHTFLRLVNKKGRNDLLDYALSYGAETDGSDPAPVYAIKGLFGGYMGRFNLAPYYIKVNEYSHSEERDLWEYNLDLNAEEIDVLVNHLWELYAAASFDYYFLDENCSSLLGHYLNLVKPEWKLTELSRGYFMPSSLIKALPSGKTKCRASAQKKLRKKLNELTDFQFSLFKKSMDEKTVPVEVDTLDAIIAFLNLEKYRKRDLTQKDALLFAQALHKPSTLPVVNENKIRGEISPDLSHGDSLVALGNGFSQGKSFQSLRGKWIHRDFLAPDRGRVPFNHFDFIDAQLIYYHLDQKFKVDHFTVVNATNLRPVERYEFIS